MTGAYHASNLRDLDLNERDFPIYNIHRHVYAGVLVHIIATDMPFIYGVACFFEALKDPQSPCI